MNRLAASLFFLTIAVSCGTSNNAASSACLSYPFTDSACGIQACSNCSTKKNTCVTCDAGWSSNHDVCQHNGA